MTFIDKLQSRFSKRVITDSDRNKFINSALFHLDYYNSIRGKNFRHKADAVDDFMNHKTDTNLSCHPGFDPVYYGDAYPDVRESGMNFYFHYCIYGFSEKRLPSANVEIYYTHILKKHKYLDTDFYAGKYNIDVDPYRHYLINGANDAFIPFEGYSGEFINRYYYQSLLRYRRSFLFFIRHKNKPWCVTNQKKLGKYTLEIRASGEFDELYYRDNYKNHHADIDPVLYYCTEGFRLLHNPNNVFSTEKYLRQYPDILQGNLIPFHHYLFKGRRESRSAGSFDRNVYTGFRAFDESKQSILICCHQASRTGAPIVGLMLTRILCEKYNIVLWSGDNGVLFEDFRNYCTALVHNQLREGCVENTLNYLYGLYQFKYAILNSAETWPLLNSIINNNIYTISLIHEFTQCARPRGRIAKMALLSDRVVVPSGLIKNEIESDLAHLGVKNADIHYHIQHQGAHSNLTSIVTDKNNADFTAHLQKLMRSKNKTRLVIGCGYVQPRKGIDVFMQVAHHILQKRNDVLFVWVGANYDPDADIAYSALVEHFICSTGIQDSIQFIDEVSDLTPIISAADCFLLSSRLDPYPNVAIDAIIAGVPVVCFADTTGIADLADVYPDLVYKIEFMNTNAAAVQINQLLDADHKSALDMSILQKLTVEFDPVHYAMSIDKLYKPVIPLPEMDDYYYLNLHNTDLFNTGLFSDLPPPHQANIVQRLRQKGLLQFNLPPDLSNDVIRVSNVRNLVIIIEYPDSDRNINQLNSLISYIKSIPQVCSIHLMLDFFTPIRNSLVSEWGEDITIHDCKPVEELISEHHALNINGAPNNRYIHIKLNQQYIDRIQEEITYQSRIEHDTDVHKVLFPWDNQYIFDKNTHQYSCCGLTAYSSRYFDKLGKPQSTIRTSKSLAQSVWGYLI